MTPEKLFICYVLLVCTFHGYEYLNASTNMIAHHQRNAVLALPFRRRLAYLLLAPLLPVPLALYTLLRGTRTGGEQ